MEINLDASIDRQRILWVATCARFPEFIAEARTVDELRGKFADALEAADLPGDTKLDVRFHYDHGTRAAAVFAATLSAVDSSDGEVESEAAGG